MSGFIPQEYAKYLGLGIQLSVTLLSGVFLGLYLDRRLETVPWLTLAGSALGFVLAFYQLYIAFKAEK